MHSYQAVKTTEHPPNASAILASMRSIGYSFESALADIVDNSITAEAMNVRIAIRKKPPHVAVLDDGAGMSEATLVDAMRLGSKAPSEFRGPNDHGRFGLGLKTASLSQCRRLTVVSKQNDQISAARWDLDIVEAANAWTLLLMEPNDYKQLPLFPELSAQTSGTIVIWETFDRLGNASTEGEIENALLNVAAASSNHLSLIFHRLISGEAGRQVKLWLNGTPLVAADPFLLSNAYTRIVGSQSTIISGSPISAVAYVLPRFNQISQRELTAAGGANRMRDLQGFYVYRSLRLITYGTWFRLANRDELSRLARIQIDIDNTSDHAWQLDIKKSSLQPSSAVRDFLATMVSCVTEASVRRFKPAASTSQVSENSALWLRTFKNDSLSFKINRNHPLVIGASATLSQKDARSVAALLDAIEISLPIKQLYFDQALNRNVALDVAGMEERLRGILEILISESPHETSADIVADVSDLEPFRSYPEITTRLCKELLC